MAARYCLDFAETALSPAPPASRGDFTEETADRNDSLFYKAMQNGIDPGAIDSTQLEKMFRDAADE